MTAALEGIRVLDLSRALAGPFAAMTLGDMGADVIKIEEPQAGDTSRGYPPFWNGISTYYLSINRNKRALTLDLSQPAGQEILRHLVSQSDILIESFKTGAMERWGVGYDELSRINPRLIYCAISAFGREGPDKHRGGVDILMQAYAGLMSITGEEGGPPVRTGTSVVDLSAGAHATQGILASLYVREKTGRGQRIDASLLGTTVAWMTYHAVAYFASGQAPGKMGSMHPSVAPYGAYPTQDGFIVMAIAFDSHWRAFCKITGRDELADDPRLATNPARIANRALLDDAMAEVLTTKPSAEWQQIFDDASIPCAPVNTLDTVLRLPQVEYLDYVTDVEHPAIDGLRMPGIHLGMSETPGTIRRHPPALGEQTSEVLREFGYSESRIAEFLASGVVTQGSQS
ncbi:MAG: CoA transferase [Thermomicrobiales bacterium]|nr:CoA transferase [Thermomicrobiales bacterium]